jgi:cephalosporin-C deacetylase-like acetyl esterase
VSPEQTLGLAPGQHQVARRLAENGFEVIVPQTLSRDKWQTHDSRLKRADYTDREWIYRQAFHMGRHVIGYEVQRVLGAVDWFAKRRERDVNIGVAGYGEGGQVALFAAALDHRIEATLVSGYFNSREAVWDEPIYRNVWSRLTRFGDAEVASLVLPSQLIIEHCPFPDVSNHKVRSTV